jgi:hypothetical protein
LLCQIKIALSMTLGETTMERNTLATMTAVLLPGTVFAVGSAIAADVTADRFANADRSRETG